MTFHDIRQKIRNRRMIKGFCTCQECIDEDLRIEQTKELLEIKEILTQEEIK